jgi:CheY-like chemotaxis protein
MSNENTILIVDDSPADLQLALNVVKEKYKVLAATSGEQAVMLADKTTPELVLMDVNMPNIDGYQCCAMIKEKHPDTLVIFLSANDSTEEILKGYDAGGDDYLVKPFEPKLLLNKIQAAFNLHAKEKSLQQEVDYASEVAMTAICSSSELGSVVNFLRNSFNVNNIDELSTIVLECLNEYGLIGSIQFRTDDSLFNYTTLKTVSELESELLNRIANMEERIYENKSRMLINFYNVSLLIKNIPVEDQEKVGRLRDFLMILIEGSNQKLDFFNAEVNAVKKRNIAISSIISNVGDSLDYTRVSQQEIEFQNVQILDDLTEDIQEMFLTLGLSQEQEATILDLHEKVQEKSYNIFQKGKKISQLLSDVLVQVNLLKDGE